MTAPRRENPTVTKTINQFVATATCLDCLQVWEAHNALAVASIHAKSFGHKVHAESHLDVTYDGRGEQ